MEQHRATWGNGYHAGLTAAGIPNRRRVIDAVAWGYPTDAPPSERLLAMMLALLADRNGDNARPGKAELAAQVGMSASQVQRLLRQMAARGIVERSISKHTRSVYKFNAEWLARSRREARTEECARDRYSDGRVRAAA